MEPGDLVIWWHGLSKNEIQLSVVVEAREWSAVIFAGDRGLVEVNDMCDLITIEDWHEHYYAA